MSATQISCLLVAITLAACSSGGAPTAEPALETDTPLPPTEVTTPPTPTHMPTAVGPTITQIDIDGDPADWAVYEVGISDPQGDHTGGDFDIGAVRAFANDRYLYVLIETHASHGSYVQLDLEIVADGRNFVVSFKPYESGPGIMGESTSSGFIPMGEVPESASAAGEAVELKMPLAVFKDTTGVTLRNVRPLTGECCGTDWLAIDEISPFQVMQVNELESAPEMAASSQICAVEIAPPVPFGTFEPAPVHFMQPGYNAEWFVTPSAFNMPRDVLLTSQNDLLVLGTRNFALFRVSLDGAVTKLADVNGMEGEVDAQDNVYVHSASDGTITLISADGASSIMVRSSDLETSCDSGFGFGPDGNLYLARNLCDFGQMDTADLYQISNSGQISLVAEQIPALITLRTAPDGRFLAGAQGQEIYEISLTDYSLSQLAVVPGRQGIAASGLTMDTQGNIYISTGTRDNSGEVYRLNPGGEITLLAAIPDNGLSGIEWLPSTGEIVGVQLQLGTLISVASDGSLREIVSGNGLITPRGIAASPCGELAVSNEDGGLMVLVDPAGGVKRFFEYNSFTSPVSFVVFEPDGTLFATEGAPGLPERVITVSSGDSWPIPYADAARPAGIVRRADGTLLVAETIADRILQINPDLSTTIFADGLTRPTALLLDSEDNLYVVTGTGGHPLEEYHMPDAGDTILRLTPHGEPTTLARWTKIAGMALAPSGDIYAATGWDGGIVQVSPEGSVKPFIAGLHEVTDLAFDLAGNLYATDAVLNGVIRIGGFPHGTLSGTVTAGSGPVEGARVQVLADWPIVIGQVLTTDADGHFSLLAAPRTYAVMITAEGYDTVTLDVVEITADQETALEIEL